MSVGKIILASEEYRFIEIRRASVLHIAYPYGPYWWQTLCGRQRRRTDVSELTARETTNDDPDSFVCRSCVGQSYYTRGAVRVESEA